MQILSAGWAGDGQGVCVRAGNMVGHGRRISVDVGGWGTTVWARLSTTVNDTGPSPKKQGVDFTLACGADVSS